MQRTFGIGFLLIVTALLLAACGPKSIERSVTLKEFGFDPDSISVPAGAKVNLSLSNTGALVHNFVIMKKGTQVTIPFDEDDEDNIYWEKEVEHGESETVEFTAPSEPGEYQVVCRTPGHLEQGMQAKLVVTQ